MILKSSCRDVEAYITKDGSSIKELMHPQVHGNSAQSIAEATVPAGASTLLHRHDTTEEIYHILAGEGILRLDAEEFNVKEGDSVCIMPGRAHCIRNTGNGELRILCCCSPAYSHEDTVMM